MFKLKRVLTTWLGKCSCLRPKLITFNLSLSKPSTSTGPAGQPDKRTRRNLLLPRPPSDNRATRQQPDEKTSCWRAQHGGGQLLMVTTHTRTYTRTPLETQQYTYYRERYFSFKWYHAHGLKLLLLTMMTTTLLVLHSVNYDTTARSATFVVSDLWFFRFVASFVSSIFTRGVLSKLK